MQCDYEDFGVVYKLLTCRLSTGIHEGAVTSIQFHPIDNSKVLTNGMDSCLKIVDLRMGMPLHILKHQDFQTSYHWSSATFSPNGKDDSASFRVMYSSFCGFRNTVQHDFLTIPFFIHSF